MRAALLTNSITDLIGDTPLAKLRSISPPNTNIYVKLEYLNPTGSHKDRIALYMVKDAVERYGLKQGDVVVEASSGNTAISVAFVSKNLGLKPVIVVDEEASSEKISMLKLLGAEVLYGSSDPTSPRNYVRIAEAVARERGGVFLNQYENPDNIRAHYETTAREIWRSLGENITAFVMGVGTGGTITGVGRFLKEKSPKIKVIAVVPKGARVVGGPGTEVIDGLASKNVYRNFDRSIVDLIVEVSRAESIEMARRLVNEEGVMAGISAGANVYASLLVAKSLPPESTIVTIAPDSAFRYLSVLLEK
ncbi:MAG: cysteine synthase family protein [Sulfolobales archaeon]|nr:cysteine synthase family protein [Sulfolobales archaeon]MDW8082744.1 cysteine synthase family protein [Sulfolobales archaeon]